MKKNYLYFIIILFIFLSAGPSVFSYDFTKEKNDQGGPYTTILNIPSSDIVYIILTFKTGTVRDPEGKEGLNYVTAKLIEEGIKKGINEKALSSGAEFSVQIDKEITTFFFKVHKDKFSEAYNIFISGIISPSFEEDMLQVSLNKALDERDNIIKNSEDLSLEMIELFIFENHPYGKPDFGTKTGLNNIKIDDLVSFYQNFYTGKNYELGVGGYNASEIMDTIKKDLTALSSGKPDDIIIKEPEEYDRNKVLIIKQDTTTTAVTLGFPVDFTRTDDDYYPLMIANAFLGEHRYMQGILFKELRDVRGFNYGNYSYLEKFVEGDQDKMPMTRIPRTEQYFSVWIRNLADENACFATKFVLYNLDKMVREGIPEERFELMRSFIYNNPGLWAYNPLQVLGFSMDSDFYNIPYFIDYIREKAEKISSDDVLKALKTRMGDKKVKIVFVTGNPEKLKEQLLGNTGCEPLYNTNLSEEELMEDEMVLDYNLNLSPEDITIIEVGELF